MRKQRVAVLKAQELGIERSMVGEVGWKRGGFGREEGQIYLVRAVEPSMELRSVERVAPVAATPS